MAGATKGAAAASAPARARAFALFLISYTDDYYADKNCRHNKGNNQSRPVHNFFSKLELNFKCVLVILIFSKQ